MWVPQRHTLPLSAVVMSSSEGLGFALSGATAAMIWPDWQ
jgi:hypothetical protein